jgi:hypothetical protein
VAPPEATGTKGRGGGGAEFYAGEEEDRGCIGQGGETGGIGEVAGEGLDAA